MSWSSLEPDCISFYSLSISDLYHQVKASYFYVVSVSDLYHQVKASYFYVVSVSDLYHQVKASYFYVVSVSDLYHQVKASYFYVVSISDLYHQVKASYFYVVSVSDFLVTIYKCKLVSMSVLAAVCTGAQLMPPFSLLCVKGTMSVSLSACSVPGHQPSFTLSQDDMELGLGKGS